MEIFTKNLMTINSLYSFVGGLVGPTLDACSTSCTPPTRGDDPLPSHPPTINHPRVVPGLMYPPFLSPFTLYEVSSRDISTTDEDHETPARSNASSASGRLPRSSQGVYPAQEKSDVQTTSCRSPSTVGTGGSRSGHLWPRRSQDVVSSPRHFRSDR